MNKKNVLIFCNENHLYEFNPRGGEISTRIIAINLHKQGHTIFLLNFNKYNKYHSYIRDGLIVLNYPIMKNYIKKQYIYNLIKEKKISFGITWSIFSKLCVPILIELNIPYILMIRWWSLFTDIRPIGDLYKNYNKNIETINTNKYIFDNAKCIITNNQWSKNLIKYYYGDNLPIKVSYVPIIKKDIVKEKTNNYILLVTPDKNLGEYELIEYLAKNMPNEKFMLLNGKKQIIAPNIINQSYTNDMDNIFIETKILLYCAYKNDVCGTSRIAIEAMRYLIPSICNKKCGLDEIIPYTVSADADYSEWIDKINYINNNIKDVSDKIKKIYTNYDVYSYLEMYNQEIN